ncbi:MAG: MBL fold metallo-hydrolase [Erysipelotrichaceae bacterium]|nr:MBL fold metallo-hydrolase [Erysipelotrichaceae bacterium]MBR5755171.1 MBL fold metallo-hydrolase [Erysipelotrichaceae bacterium]
MQITINCHSSIRVATDKIIYFDPFKIEEETHDADIIFITHDHFDHFSVEDIKKVEKEDTVYVIPDCMYNLLGGENVVTVNPGEKNIVEGYEVLSIPSYNVHSSFHPKEKGYVGYVVTIEGKRVYVAGDCDMNEDNTKLSCDIALVPVGGKYTMDYKEAAELINTIRPELAIPDHYGGVAGSMEDGEKFRELVDKDIRVEILV